MAKPKYDFSDFDEKRAPSGKQFDFSDFDEPAAAPPHGPQASSEELTLGRAFGAPINQSTNPKAGAAMLQGFGEQASFGYLPQLQGIAEVVGPNPSSDVDAKLRAEGFKLPADPTYVQARDAAIDRSAKLSEAAPESFMAGQVGGALSGGAGVSKGLGLAGKTMGLVGQTAKPAGLLMRGMQSAGAGAIQGGIQNPGDVQGQIDPLQAEARKKNAFSGAFIGAGAQLGLSALSKGSAILGKLPETAKNYAQLKALKASGAMLKDFRNAADRGRVGKLGQQLIDKGLVEPGATFESIAEKSADLKSKAGQVIGDIYEQAAKEAEDPALIKSLSGDKVLKLTKTTLDADRFADTLEKEFNAGLKGKAGGTKAFGSVQPILEELRSNGSNVNLGVLQEFKEGLDDIIKYNRDLSQEPLSKQYLFKVRDFLKDRIQDRVGALDDVLGKDRLRALKDANDQYGVWAELSRISKDRVNRESANRMMSLTDTIVAAGGVGGGAAAGYHQGGMEGALKGAAVGAGMGLINKAGRQYGNPLLIKGANLAGGTAGAIPTALPRAIGAGAGLLAQNPMISGAAATGLLQQPQKVKP